MSYRCKRLHIENEGVGGMYLLGKSNSISTGNTPPCVFNFNG